MPLSYDDPNFPVELYDKQTGLFSEPIRRLLHAAPLILTELAKPEDERSSAAFATSQTTTNEQQQPNLSASSAATTTTTTQATYEAPPPDYDTATAASFQEHSHRQQQQQQQQYQQNEPSLSRTVLHETVAAATHVGIERALGQTSWFQRENTRRETRYQNQQSYERGVRDGISIANTTSAQSAARRRNESNASESETESSKKDKKKDKKKNKSGKQAEGEQSDQSNLGPIILAVAVGAASLAYAAYATHKAAAEASKASFHAQLVTLLDEVDERVRAARYWVEDEYRQLRRELQAGTSSVGMDVVRQHMWTEVKVVEKDIELITDLTNALRGLEQGDESKLAAFAHGASALGAVGIAGAAGAGVYLGTFGTGLAIATGGAGVLVVGGLLATVFIKTLGSKKSSNMNFLRIAAQERAKTIINELNGNEEAIAGKARDVLDVFEARQIRLSSDEPQLPQLRNTSYLTNSIDTTVRSSNINDDVVSNEDDEAIAQNGAAFTTTRVAAKQLA
ncbi:hypothetical protein GQ42DRAFT_162509 [Ramicandelaber brevisporus]|nr:hypothetical protein GQ42DRAFT_162509 [Ramicandelaber brevisporus]